MSNDLNIAEHSINNPITGARPSRPVGLLTRLVSELRYTNDVGLAHDNTETVGLLSIALATVTTFGHRLFKGPEITL